MKGALTDEEKIHIEDWRVAEKYFFDLAERQRPKREAFERHRLEKYANPSKYTGPSLDCLQREIREEYREACRSYFRAQKKAFRRGVFELI